MIIRSGKVIDLSKSRRILRPVEVFDKREKPVEKYRVFLKPGKNKMMTPFHQDNYFWNVIGARAVNIWIACSLIKKRGGLFFRKIASIRHN